MKEEKISMSAIIEATFKRMPWLDKHFNKQEIHKVSFRSFTHDLLGQECELGWRGFDDDIPYIKKSIIFFSNEGKLIGQVGVKVEPAQANVTWRFLFWKGIQNIPEEQVLFQETVGQALKRLDPKYEAFYVVGLLGSDLIITIPSEGTKNIRQSTNKELDDAESFVIKQLS
jgi:hypothetical protein